MWCSTRFNSWTLIISDLCKRPKSSIKHIRPNNVRRRHKFFYSHHQIKTLFETINSELKNISQWFRANNLSLNIKETKYTLFHKYSVKDKIPLK